MDINKEKMKEYVEIYISYLHKKYAHPASIDGYLSKEDYKEYLDYFQKDFYRAKYSFSHIGFIE